ncbi:hypothetical protein TcasGA2_TC034656 [Tribolium castaneum]|uniref:Chitin-binding type-2 domain-containing protein n=1 Tax=Tribolium castaneum TaxID=7070 RepID=A0A139WJD4_TRICA|nr:hypothetical protein TcasGA2_TC034656 [Tribolium castaneum]
MLILKILICFYLSKICGACNPSLFNSRPQVSERKICTQEGRFVNSEDTTCSTYYVCALQNESLVPKKYSCPLGTLFDPNLRVCSAIYKCSSSSAVTFNNANSSEFSLTSCMLDKDSTENFKELQQWQSPHRQVILVFHPKPRTLLVAQKGGFKISWTSHALVITYVIC